MTKELREYLQSLESKKTEARSILDSAKEEKRSLTDEENKKFEDISKDIKDLEGKISIEMRAAELNDDSALSGLKMKDDSKKEDDDAFGERRSIIESKEYRSAFLKAVVNASSGREIHKLTEGEQRAMKEVRALSEGVDAEGGLSVPADIQKTIEDHVLKCEHAWRNDVKVIPVKSNKGSRVIKKGAIEKLYNTDEKASIQALKGMEFDKIDYIIHKFAGILPISNELDEDSVLEFKEELIEWLNEACINTENEQILYGIGDAKNSEGIMISTKITSFEAPATPTIKTLRRMKNMLHKKYRFKAKWYMNTQAQEYYAELKYPDGKYILSPDPKNPDEFIMFGRPVEIRDDILTEDDLGVLKTKVLFGDLKSLYGFFDRKKVSVKITDIGGDAFVTDQILARAIARFDGKILDNRAAVRMDNMIVESLEAPTA